MSKLFAGSKLFKSILDSSVMLGNYLLQTTSADDIFRCIFFLGTLRVKIDKSHLRNAVVRLVECLFYFIYSYNI